MVSFTPSVPFAFACFYVEKSNILHFLFSCSNAKNACAFTVGDAFNTGSPIGNDSCNAEKACCGQLARKYTITILQHSLTKHQLCLTLSYFFCQILSTSYAAVPPNSCNGTGECCVEANCPGGCPTTQSQNAKISAVTDLEAPVSTDGQAGRSAAILGTRALIGAPNGNVQGNPLGVAYYISNVS
jgi:hypothetical protein